jgi:hypothetical protein
MRKSWRLGPLKFSKLVTWLGLWRQLLTLSLLHIVHRLLHGLQHLSLHHQDLLKDCVWWWIVGTVLIGGVVAVVSVRHLVIMERFEIEIKINDSQLYASRYNDDSALLR